jgi:hypothetical protein
MAKTKMTKALPKDGERVFLKPGVATSGKRKGEQYVLRNVTTKQRIPPTGASCVMDFNIRRQMVRGDLVVATPPKGSIEALRAKEAAKEKRANAKAAELAAQEAEAAAADAAKGDGEGTNPSADGSKPAK